MGSRLRTIAAVAWRAAWPDGAMTVPIRRAVQPIRRIASGLGRAPLTVAVVLVLWIVGAATDSLLTGPSRDLLSLVGVGIPPLREGHWWMPLTAPLWCSGPVSYVVTTALVVTLLPPAE